MAPPTLPQDIIDLILDDLARGARVECLPSLLSCSTVHSSFVHTCQKHIFRSVTLTCPPDPYTPFEPRYELYESSMLFVDAVTHSPHLGTHLHDLTLKLSDAVEVDGHNKNLVLAAISQLPAVESIVVEGCIYTETWRRARCFVLDQKTTMATLALMQRSHLRSLSLCMISSWPRALISAAHSLESLSLVQSSLEGDCNDLPTLEKSGVHAMSPPLKGLKHLSCDPSSLSEWVNTFLKIESGRGGTQDTLPCLQTLDVRLDGYSVRAEFGEGPAPLLKQVKRLRSLKIQFGDVWLQSTSTTPLLRHLHPGSFCTLLHLTYSVVYLCPLPGEVIHDPYHGLCEILPEFVQLQSLRINLVFQGTLVVDWAISFGSQWGQLCDIVLLPGPIAMLKELSVNVGIRVPDNVSPDYTFDYAGNAEKMRQHLLESVYPAQFQALDDLHSEGLMSFSFDVKVAVSSYVNDAQDMFVDY